MPVERPVSSPLPSSALLVAAIILLGLNLRPILAAIGPLLDSIQAGTGLSNADAGLLTTVPVFAMGVCALAGAQLQRSLGVARGISLGIAIIAAACALRWTLHGSGGLIATAGSAHRASSACQPQLCASGEADAAAMAAPPMMPVV